MKWDDHVNTREFDIPSSYPKSREYDAEELKLWYKSMVNGLYGPSDKEEEIMLKKNYTVKKILFNPPATIVFWEDGSKTVVKCSQYDEYSPYFGFLASLAKKIYGNPSRVRKIVDKWAPKEEESSSLSDIAKTFEDYAKSIQSFAEILKGEDND